MSADAPEMPIVAGDDRAMADAIAQAERARFWARPNPWVGAVVVASNGAISTGFTEPPGRRHAERVALEAAGDGAAGATVYVTLEPCSHHGRTPPCADALIQAGVARVVVGVTDPDPKVAGAGIGRLQDAGIQVDVGVGHDAVSAQLAPYLHHRRTGRPLVVLKLAATMDGRTAAPDGTSQWITGAEARADAHRLRAESDAIVVGAGTVRADDPSLTVRDWSPSGDVALPEGGIDPRRIVLGTAPDDARARPTAEASGELEGLLDQWADEGILQLMVEGGAGVAGDFHRRGLVDRYVLYLAPALLGGDEGAPLLGGPGAATMADLWRGRVHSVAPVGDDLRIELRPASRQKES
jgi:diaminohydroxyphosphoribosylaminopyrimidine deaminase/5-amino-6-(5-phosphoribosylamino)uracil reductase